MPKMEVTAKPLQVVERGQVVAAFLEEMVSASQELRARREFDGHVSAFLKERGLVQDFDKFRSERSKPVQKKRKR